MANPKQLEILKQGIRDWNQWRIDNPDIDIDLSKANLWKSDLRNADLRKANLSGAILVETNLNRTKLTGANLTEANLLEANCTGANLWKADLSKANLRKVDLTNADLSEANCTAAIFWEANLTDTVLAYAILRHANFRYANLTDAYLTDADLENSHIGYTIFGHNDLGSSLGLERIDHLGPSILGIDTIRDSKGKIPIAFLRGCGLRDWEIESVKLYKPDLSNDEFIDIQNRIFDLRQRQVLQISPLFISYSRSDGPFVDKLEKLLNEKGIRFWRDIHDMKAGRVEKQIDRAIRQNPTVLLVLSENSIRSDWVQHEVHTARDLEKEMERDVLCPVALDDSWQHSPWPKRLMEQVLEYNILDCSCWQDDHEFRRVFVKLVEGLNLYYKKV